MGLVYDLKNKDLGVDAWDIDSVYCYRQMNCLRKRFSPRGECKDYILKYGGSGIFVKRADFDLALSHGLFFCGPHFSRDFRQAFGTIGSDVIIYCELLEDVQGDVDRLFEIVNF